MVTNGRPWGILERSAYSLSTILCVLVSVRFLFLLPDSVPSHLIDSKPQHETSQSGANNGSASIKLHPLDHSRRAAHSIYLDWTITKAERRPDGVKKEIFLIDGQFPGPTVEARSGDDIHIKVHNELGSNETIAIHWHGLKVSNEMDGVVGLTQCGITIGQTFEYHLHIRDDQDGTFWYHSHSDVHRADGLYGALIVHRPEDQVPQPPAYADDQVLMVGDWYHHPAATALADYLDFKNFKNEIPPDSMLLNGQGSFNCANTMPAFPVDCEEKRKPFIDSTTGRTRLRIINVGSFAGFHIVTPGSTARPITVDGGGVVDHSKNGHGVGIIHPGERVDIILEGDGTSGRRALVVQLDESDINRPNLALTSCQSFSLQSLDHDVDSLAFFSTEQACEAAEPSDYVDYKALAGLDVGDDLLTTRIDNTMLLYGTISYLSQNGNKPQGELNHSSWVPRGFEEMPLLALSRSDWPTSPAPLIPRLSPGWVDIVLNNMDDKGHPFHLHGYDFHVMARVAPSRVGGFEMFNPFEGGSSMKYAAEPVRKDTVHVPSRGHVVLRFHADTPGLWFFHCHVIWHQAIGMAMALQVTDDNDLATWDHLEQAARKSCT